jgi:hypothetical protein
MLWGHPLIAPVTVAILLPYVQLCQHSAVVYTKHMPVLHQGGVVAYVFVKSVACYAACDILQTAMMFCGI